MIRQFSLLNAYGETYDLTVDFTAFMHSVGGLGAQFETEFQRIGGQFSLLSYYAAQGKVTGKVKLWSEQEFFEFAKFCQRRPITLLYTRDNQAFRRNGIITSISKDETEPLNSNIEFTCTTPFYTIVSVYNGGSVVGGKIYPYTYNFEYAENAAQSVTISSDSMSDSPCRITIYGYAENPTWSHYLNNQLIATGKVNATIAADRKLVIDTTVIPYQIHLYDLEGNFVQDLYQSSDFSTDRFFTLGYGQNVISVSAESVGTVRLGVEGMIEYEAV